MQYTKLLLIVTISFAATAAVGADEVDNLIAAITGDNNEARMAAADQAGPLGAAAVERLGKLVASDEYLVARAAKLALEKIVAVAGAPDSEASVGVAQALLKLAQPGQPAPTRRDAIHFLGWIGGPDNATAIAELLTDEEIADSARMALQRIPGEAVVEALLAAAPNVDDTVQPGIFYAVAERGAEDAIPILMDLAKSRDKEKSWMAFDVLTRLGVAPLEIIPRTHAKDLADRKRYANGFLRAADTQLAHGNREAAERMYAAVAAFPISPQHGCAALIGLKNAQSPKLIEHALGYLVERGIREVAERTLTEADVKGIDDYLMKAYGVTNAGKQRVLLKVLAARAPEGINRFLNEARHNESAMVRFTAAQLLSDVPSPDAFEAAVASAPPFERAELARTYYDMAVAKQRAGDLDTARDMAHVLITPEFDSSIREGAFRLIEAASSPASATVLLERIGAAYRSADASQPPVDPFDGNRSLAIAAGRAYVAVLVAAAENDPSAIDELANVSENAFHAEVSNYAEEQLNAILGSAFDVSRLPEPFIYDPGYLR